jgi:predicted O-linked N-acetylglucosamine transferase (SPINDLY family)
MNDHILQNAWRLHQAGNFAEAARLYNEVLRMNPRHPGALQMLGFLHFQRGEFADAERIMEKAVKLDPKSVDALYNRGCALQALNRSKEALSCFDRALALKPDYAPAMLNRGNVLSQMGRFADALASYDLAQALMPASAELTMNRGNALFELERYGEALASYEAALKQEPREPLLWNNRGNALSELGRHQDAVGSFTRALVLDPAYSDALANRGNALTKLDRNDEALADFEKTLSMEPANIAALHSRGRLLIKRKRHAEALTSFERILALDPAHAEAASERGIVLIELKNYEEALTAFDRALQIASDSVETLSNRASVLVRLKRYEEALANSDRAIALDPSFGAAWHNRGSALAGLKRYKEALTCYDKALALAPENANTWNNRGATMISLKQDEAALSDFETALRINPADADSWSNRARAFSTLKRFPDAIADSDRALALDPGHAAATRIGVHSRLHTCDWQRREEDKRRITAGLMAGSRVIEALDHRGLCDSEGENLVAARLWVAEECPATAYPLWRGERYQHDKIRIAYLSTDFRAHAVAFLIVGIFEHHDKDRFETVAISFSRDDKSETRTRIETAFDRFIDVQEMNDSQVAALMRDMEIDIAIDLNGYTGDSRTAILAQRPVPVQVNYLGYPGTMGAPYIDYIIADRIVIPEEHRVHYSEKVVYLPDAYQANDRKRRIADRTPTRAEAGLPEHGFVFASFNNTYKIGPEVFDVWMRLLRDVEGSVLWLLEDNSIAAAKLKRETHARGIAPERLVFAPRTQPDQHLARHRLADLFLDTLPYNAHTTASDALWMGLPLVTCPGSTFPGRVAASLLSAIGMPELVTASLADYEVLALKLAREPAALAAIKAKLAANRDTHPMFDTARFARYLESAYVTMWERQQRGDAPANFTVPVIP